MVSLHFHSVESTFIGICHSVSTFEFRIISHSWNEMAQTNERVTVTANNRLTRLLLKYASRDEVTLLGRGTGGVPDVRATVEVYEEKSPLYGFLQYRRRKIVLKYVPDGISRLVQGRPRLTCLSVAAVTSHTN